MTSRTILSALALALINTTHVSAQERQIRVDVTVGGTPQQVWPIWTTNEGVRSFFAPGSNIDLKVGGLYEVFFAPAAPAGRKGADGMRLLAVELNRRLVFTWNAPEQLAYVRAQQTVVSVDFAPVGPDSTRVTLRHTGWGTGPEWDEAINYFEPAWNGFVMASFKRRMEHGPIDWKAVPKLEPVRRNAIEQLAVVR